MKISSRQYAISLYEAVQAVPRAKVEAVLGNFLQILSKNNDMSRANSILEEFSRVWDQAEGVAEAEVVSANKLSKENVKLLEDYVAELTKAGKVKINNSIDEKILAGFILKVGDQVIDGSLKTKIKELKEELIK